MSEITEITAAILTASAVSFASGFLLGARWMMKPALRVLAARDAKKEGEK